MSVIKKLQIEIVVKIKKTEEKKRNALSVLHSRRGQMTSETCSKQANIATQTRWFCNQDKRISNSTDSFLGHLQISTSLLHYLAWLKTRL